ncbi:phytanoyl-CoA dioxygenase family protein [Cryomorpha ignava]|uniref:Phytanoyl-CoA dioxygenase family protein n=1 Tax=Cryomorpha ignava TaxID=101383 RepID=A0A7K3WP30_9FLAO|nr:phytanoyl-CoA dioxygenase family protein [Cryomorpha ignava]NEN23407.1 phytanoyl-CoA dioxygenase family protein [Cryomorpha ignava]
MRSYGFNIESGSQQGLLFEDIERKGYSLLKSLITSDAAADFCNLLESVYEKQCEEFGLKELELINELNIVRCPLGYKNDFLKLALNETILNIVESVIGKEFQLHLQNAVINRANSQHHQSAWHRDLPYQNWVCSKVLSINAFFCLTPFNIETGGTQFIESSHLSENIPSKEFMDKHAKTLIAEPGDVIIFNSMLLHRAGQNVSNMDRFGINHVYTVPIISQQIDLPRFLTKENIEDAVSRKILGYKYESSVSVNDYRLKRMNKK